MKNPPQYHFIYHKSNTDWRGMESWTPLYDGFDFEFFSASSTEKNNDVFVTHIEMQ